MYGIKVVTFSSGLSIEVNNTGLISIEVNGIVQNDLPPIFYSMAKSFKYGPNFIIKISSDNIQFFDDHISFYKYKLNPIDLTISSNNKSITYSGKSTVSVLSIRDDDIDIAFKKIDPITNPKFTAQIHGQDSHKIEYACAADFHHCKVCPFRSQVVNCILGHKVNI